MAGRLKPEVVVLDITMAGGSLAAIGAIVADHPAVNVLVLTAADSTEAVTAAMRAGARGYLLKDASVPQLVETVRTVSRGKFLRSSGAGRAAIARPAGGGSRGGNSVLDPQQPRTGDHHAPVQGPEQQGDQAQAHPEREDRQILPDSNVLKKLHVRNRVEAALLYSDHMDFSDTSPRRRSRALFPACLPRAGARRRNPAEPGTCPAAFFCRTKSTRRISSRGGRTIRSRGHGAEPASFRRPCLAPAASSGAPAQCFLYTHRHRPAVERGKVGCVPHCRH